MEHIIDGRFRIVYTCGYNRQLQPSIATAILLTDSVPSGLKLPSFSLVTSILHYRCCRPYREDHAEFNYIVEKSSEYRKVSSTSTRRTDNKTVVLFAMM